MQDDGAKRILTVHWDLCIFCGQCQAACPTDKGIMLSNEFDLATTERRQELFQTIEKRFVSCCCCGENIAAYEQILWVARRLGPLIFSNASLMLFYLRNLDLAAKEDSPPKKKEELLRSDRIKILCPRCRREAVLKS
jgi:hydrogenase-4 component H